MSRFVYSSPRRTSEQEFRAPRTVQAVREPSIAKLIATRGNQVVRRILDGADNHGGDAPPTGLALTALDGTGPALPVTVPDSEAERDASGLAKGQTDTTALSRLATAAPNAGTTPVPGSTGLLAAPILRRGLERRLGADLSEVRIHNDSVSHDFTRGIGANAATWGSHVYFAEGQFAPDTLAGQELLQHELIHTLQADAQSRIYRSPDSEARLREIERQLASLVITDEYRSNLEYERAALLGAGNLVGGNAITSQGQGQSISGVAEFDVTAGQSAALLVEEPAPVAPSVLAPRTAMPPLASGSATSVQAGEVDFELEQVTASQQSELALRGIRLPSASMAAVDPRHHRDYIDLRATAVGFGVYLGGYLVYCDGLPSPVLVPESQVDLASPAADTPDPAIYPNHTEAVQAIPFGPPAPGHGPSVTFYRAAGGAVVAPTTFSPATTPRIVECALRARRELVEQVQHDLVVLAVSLVAGLGLRAAFNQFARIGGGPTPFPLSGETFGARMAREMSAAGYRGNPYREFMRRMNALPRRLPPKEAAEAIKVATRAFTNGTQGTMPPVQIGDILVVPSRAGLNNAPVMGIKENGTVVMGRAPRLEIVTHTPEGKVLFPPQARIYGDIIWE
ncbi:DUF4157 domain-containing protein [Nocardia asiatica]|uniref:eCIS core domain-containing protein n=1 Tax=Nocardia asiatica TaxID=209252 RepID=UPI00245885A9|nr:DUF4157 domain-containing protein [Nocardia asiatica]